ncbi:unnamed protein product [Zymoseptoria tritici ST99CH_3D7]|uniref:Carrier domain-containing protein n=1 Tax=Zymoseptoria tritici (strain ST99CH_3D7) TaxID=1276538 RepID=A0A1X7RZ71_ZYMT9|nr:unnamed protein product [Zymoseptoria tritici ST99CH_3D7]
MTLPTNADVLLSESHGPPLPSHIPSLRHLLSRPASQRPTSLALVCMHQPATHIPITFPPSTLLSPTFSTPNDTKYLRWSHSQLHYAAGLLARNLRARGVERGMPIAVLLGNGVEWMVAFFAAVRLKCAFVPLNPKCVGNANEAAYMLKLSGAKVLIVGDDGVALRLEESLADSIGGMVLRVVAEDSSGERRKPDGWVGFGELFDESVTEEEQGEEDEKREAEEDEVAMMPFTSGTTSLPKAALHTSTSLSASILSLASAIPFTSSSKNCCHMPLFHIGGIIFGVGFIAAGGATIIPSASFSASASLRAVEEEGCTDLPSVPSIVSLMAAEEKVGEVDLSSLKVVELGATTILEEHRVLVGKALRCAVVTNGYAATEGVPISLGRFSTRSGEGGKIHTGTVCPGARVRICDVESGKVVQRGVAGEIHFGGEMCIKGYVGGTSAESFYKDEVGEGWFKSGDQGVMREDGTLEVVGRYKDLIIRGGENIAPAAIEAGMDVKLGISAQVVGVKSEEAGEVPVAVLTKTDPNVSLADIRKTLIAELGTAFVPENIYSLEDLGLKDYPRTSSGKVRKIDLKKIVQKYEDSINTQPSSTPNDSAVGSPIRTSPHITETDLIALWRKLLGVQVSRDSSIHDFADSLTIMRFRNRIKQDFGLDITSEALLSADTIASQAALLSSLSTSLSPPSPIWQPTRSGPPTVDDISLTLGSPSVYDQIRQSVSTALSPLGFTWQDDVESILPSWDLGYEVFGSVAGTAKVNHRMAVTTKFADTDQLYSALCKAVEMHAMQRSFELVGPKGEPTMRVVVRANEKWFRYFSSGMEVLEVENPEELVRLLNDGTHFAEVESPFPSFLVRLARVKSTGTAGLIWALQHSAFDGLSLSTFLDDLDALLQPGHLPSSSLPPHIPYKPWADMYYLHRTSLAATRSVQRQVVRLSTLPTLRSSLLPPTPPTTTSTPATHRRTYIAPKFSTLLPHLSSLRKEHGIPPFILVKAALSIFLARKTGTSTAVFSQNENGRSWPFVEEWQQALLPNCMDLAGPTLERTVQIIPVPFSYSSSSSSTTTTTVLDFLLSLKRKQDEEAPDVHAPWNLVRQALRGGEEARGIFDTAAMSTCLNFLPVRTLNGEMVFENLQYHETRANCETAWLVNCWVEEGRDGGDQARLWTQSLADEGVVGREEVGEWSRQVAGLVAWLGERGNWGRGFGGGEERA